MPFVMSSTGPRLVEVSWDGPPLGEGAVTLEGFSVTGKSTFEKVLRGGSIRRCAELTNCAPVMSRADLETIRDNVTRETDVLAYTYGNVGGSLDGTGVGMQAQRIADAMGSGEYCYSQADQDVIDQLMYQLDRAKNVSLNIYAQFERNFSYHLGPLRQGFQNLRNTAANATNDIRPIIDAFNAVVNAQFQWSLAQGINGALDQEMAEYNSMMGSLQNAYDDGVHRVQMNFERDYHDLSVTNDALHKAYDIWDKVDGEQGYQAFKNSRQEMFDYYLVFQNYVIEGNPHNNQIIANVQGFLQWEHDTFGDFPRFVKFVASPGLALDSGTSALKFYSRQLVLNIAQAAGQEFTSRIAVGQSLVATGLSYQHGGKMPPHKEHKDGKDCDLFSAYFKAGTASYDEAICVKFGTYLVQKGVTRLIFTSTSAVNAINRAAGGQVAVNLPGHDTHMHFDVDNAT